MSIPLKIKPGDKFTNDYGDITAIRFVEKVISGNHRRTRTMWEFECYCGKLFIRQATDIKSGNTRSCGCLLAEARRTMGERLTKMNRARKRGESVATVAATGKPRPTFNPIEPEEPAFTFIPAAERKKASLLTGLIPNVVIERTAPASRIIKRGE